MATDPTSGLRELAQDHAQEAERLLKGRWISAHIKAQAHASPASYYERLRADASTRGDAAS
jgi:hypothetical protein